MSWAKNFIPYLTQLIFKSCQLKEAAKIILGFSHKYSVNYYFLFTVYLEFMLLNFVY